jgi:lipid-binding SYLF domain-containing protein
MRRMIALAAAFLLAGIAVSSSAAIASGAEENRAREAVSVLDKIMRIPEQSVPQSMLDNAHAIAVIPGVVKAGFMFGGRFGRGLISVRGPNGVWSNPSFVSIAGGSFGFQAGIQSTDVVLVFTTSHGVDSIVHGKFTLGADASAAAGPVGRTAEISTDEKLKAEIYSYSRARGLFAGVALDGAVLAIDDRSNEAIYGHDTTPRAIFEGRVSPPPAPIVDFRDRLEEYSASNRFHPGQQPPPPAQTGQGNNGPAQPQPALSQPVQPPPAQTIPYGNP